MGDVEQGEVCVVFAFAKAGSGAPVMTLSFAVVVVGVPVELPAITGNEPSTSVGGFWSRAGTTSSPTSGIWRTSSAPLLIYAARLRWAGDVRRGGEAMPQGVKPPSWSRRAFLDGHQLQSGQ